MKKLKLPFTILFVLAGNILFGQSVETIQKYISRFKDIAIEEEIRTGVPAAITLAQGIHETGAGTSELVIASNNHFGIKCKSDWSGQRVYHDDDARGECFRKYDDPIQSYKDHSDFLKNRPYYTSLFTLDPMDYKSWANGLKKAGYATNPKYAQILIRIIETYQLQQYTLIALGKKSPENEEATWASSKAEKSIQKEEVRVTPLVTRSIVNYPSGVFRINETRVIFVPQGTAYLRIADEHDLSLSRLFEFNDMAPADIAPKDGLVYLQRKRKVGNAAYHIVQEGENIHDIAQLEGIRIENLMEYNFLKTGMQPMAGEQLNLQSKAAGMPRLQVSQSQQAAVENGEIKAGTPVMNTILHVVQPKETVYAISKKYAVGVEDVMKWNELRNTELKTGQQLRINKKTADATN